MRITIDDEAGEALQEWMDQYEYENKSLLILTALEALYVQNFDDIYAPAKNKYFMEAESEINDLVKRIHRLRLGERVAQIDTMVAYVTANCEVLEAGMNILLRPAVRRKKLLNWLLFWRNDE